MIAMEHSLSVAEVATAITTASAKSWRQSLKISDAKFADFVAESEAMLIRRIRHWTLTGALLPIGATHSGSGKHRRYGSESVYEAAILNKLADWGMPIGILKGTITVIRQAIARGEAKQLWDKAVAGHETVFLYAVPLSVPVQDTSDTPDVMAGLMSESSISRFSKVAGAVLLNLSIIFHDISL
jgi:hypothetical protein